MKGILVFKLFFIAVPTAWGGSEAAGFIHRLLLSIYVYSKPNDTLVTAFDNNSPLLNRNQVEEEREYALEYSPNGACLISDIPNPEVHGILLTADDNCDLRTKLLNAQNMNYSGVIFFTNDSTLFRFTEDLSNVTIFATILPFNEGTRLRDSYCCSPDYYIKFEPFMDWLYKIGLLLGVIGYTILGLTMLLVLAAGCSVWVFRTIRNFARNTGELTPLIVNATT